MKMSIFLGLVADSLHTKGNHQEINCRNTGLEREWVGSEMLNDSFFLNQYLILVLEMVQELKRFPTLQAEIAAAANEALERFRGESRKTALRLVDMESSYLTVDFFRKLPQEVDKGGNPVASSADRYAEEHYNRIASNVSSYVKMVSETLRNTIPKAVVHCQVREAERSLLDHFYVKLGKKEVSY